ncbi:NAD-dependent succinate-semialdehyde dehydrogenase [Algibacter lectus]|uniref:Succinate-semialdehyde dehydrogenase/glutarate-semialdehyde dehydrogenase n=1 Tax=Algibacter lectus TaxID=221126 RepID=A0A4R8MDU5_9FLAO|nr:NAD-dependent succinate-semialdehyde dehydrogenase [Algibacter lectus]TDY63980.1 succinate-semialdehyde dehydrogenase/glutarate-semialdehyde dehydrogenase [Algibacter lectus]
MITTNNPFNNKDIETYKLHTESEVQEIIDKGANAFKDWKMKTIGDRTDMLNKVSQLLLERKQEYAELMTKEMGKPISQSIAEIEKCSAVCDFYVKNAAYFLADELIKTDAKESFISYDPSGTILAIMPWNYPFWQVMRFAAPTLTAGNTAILKHASNTTGCALAMERLFIDAGYPEGCFQTVLIGHEDIETIIAHESVAGVTLTGSEKAGRSIAALAGKHLKKSVMELGGNNACIILEDAKLEKHIDTIVMARMQNAGQSCIAAKRFIVVDAIYDEFIEAFKKRVAEIKKGDPMEMDTEIGVMARKDLVEGLEKQVEDSIKKSAKVTYGYNNDGNYFEPTILEDVKPGMPAFDEELFGPVAAIIRVADKQEAIETATHSKFGLGTMIFTKDLEAARKLISDIPDGAFFINDMVKSDPQLPFGGTKASGYGRELSQEGILEFVNKKTVYIKK